MSNEVAARRDLRNSSSNVVKPTIFVPGSMPRSTDAASTPFILGMLRSRITRAGACSLAFSMAATPSSASQHALKGVAVSMKLQMAPRTAALSSTTRIHGVRRDGIAEETTSVYCLRQYEFSALFVALGMFWCPINAHAGQLDRRSINCFVSGHGFSRAARRRLTLRHSERSPPAEGGRRGLPRRRRGSRRENRRPIPRFLRDESLFGFVVGVCECPGRRADRRFARVRLRSGPARTTLCLINSGGPQLRC